MRGSYVCNSVNSYAAYRDSLALYNLAYGSTNCLEFSTRVFLSLDGTTTNKCIIF